MPARDIEVLKGKTNPHILLIAPHGYPDPDNDENTGVLVRAMQRILDCGDNGRVSDSERAVARQQKSLPGIPLS
jgi:hypothetical protein